MIAILEKFEKYLEHINILERAADTIFWDMRTVMPEEGFKGQAQAATYFSTEVFKLSTSDELMESHLKMMQKEYHRICTGRTVRLDISRHICSEVYMMGCSLKK